MEKDFISKEDFINKLKNKIDFPYYERRRKTLLFKMIFSYLVAIVLLCLCILAVIWFFISDKMNSNIAFFIILGFLLVCVLLYTYMVSIPGNFYDKFKNSLKKLLGEDINYLFGIKNFHNFKYDCASEIKKSDLFADFSDIEIDDIIGNDDFVAMETKLIQIDAFEGKHGKEEYSSTIYKGLILLFKSNKPVNSKTIITTLNDNNINNYISIKGILRNLLLFLWPCFVIIGYVLYLYVKELLLGKLPNDFLLGLLITIVLCMTPWVFIVVFHIMSTRVKNRKRFEKLKLEDISFDKRFKVYSENQVEGRYLVTPAFMERLQNIKTAFGTNNLKCSFYDNKIMFALSTNKDLFEFGNLYQPFGKDIEKFYDEIVSIYEMIDYFKLNERTGL